MLRLLATWPQQVVCVVLVDKRAALHRSRPQADQSCKCVHGKLNGQVARHARHTRYPSSILARMSRVSGVSARMSRWRYKDATKKLLPWNSSLTFLGK